MPDGVLPVKVKTPSASILKGPVVIGVTSVLAVVTGLPLKVSFVVTLPIVVAVVDVGVVTLSVTASKVLPTTTVTVAWSQLVGLAPVSQIS